MPSQAAAGRLFSLGAWAGGIILVLYGGVLTLVEILAVAGAFAIPDDSDLYALKWHAFFWDPWFLLWGICILVALVLRLGSVQADSVRHDETGTNSDIRGLSGNN